MKNQHTEKSNEQKKINNKPCWLCKGYGFIKSYCDAPDSICPACSGYGTEY